MAAITATTPPTMIPNVPLLSLFITYPNALRVALFRQAYRPNLEQSSQDSGQFKERQLRTWQCRFAKSFGRWRLNRRSEQDGRSHVAYPLPLQGRVERKDS